ncbi:C-factor [Dactylella cylindrospora]|nr:C-factor [Dactylella cylindrospora]
MGLSMQTNVIGVTYTINSFLPLIRAGEKKKIVAVSSLNGDIDATLKLGKLGAMAGAVPYSVSKAAMNCLIAKFSIELRKEGILAFAISPGYVLTDATAGRPEELQQRAFNLWKQVYPDFDMKIAMPVESVKRMMNCIENLVTMEQAGEHLSFKGDKEFL